MQRLQQTFDRIVKLKDHHHARQLGLIAAVAVVGLFSGSLVSAKFLKNPNNATTTPTFTPTTLLIAQTSTITEIPSPVPTPIPSPAVASPKPSVAQTTKAPVKNQPIVVKAKKSQFRWGVTLMPYPFREKNEEFLPEQFRLAQELGVNTVRIDYSPKNQRFNDLSVELAKKHNIELVFIIPFGPNDIFTDPKLYDSAYSYVADIVRKYKDDIAIWQLANEVGSVALANGGLHGVATKDYPEDKYIAVSTWLKAAGKAVADIDPGARRLLTDHWVHTGFFERFIKDGGEFEILGWNWFSDMGRNMDRVILDQKTGQTYKLLSKLETFKKELWLTEVNRRLGSSGGQEKEQADFIQTMAEFAYATPSINGFLVFNLAEDTTARIEETGYGLIYTDIDSKTVSGLKPAFSRYRDLIKAKPKS